MKLITYLDNRSQELAAQMQRERQFSWFADGEQNACQVILDVVRFFFKFAYIPRVLFNFLLVNVGLKAIPRPEVDLLKAQMANDQLSSRNKKAKKLGFKEMPANELN